MKKLIFGLILTLYVSISQAAGIITDTDLFTCNGVSCTLKYGMSLSTSTNLTVGGTAISGGTNGYYLYNNAGVLGNTNTISATTGTFSSTVTAYRYTAGGTALSSGNFSLTAGGGGTWGAGSSIGSVSGTDQGFTATVTTAGTPAANPILTLTFADGPWSSQPFATCGAWINGTNLIANVATTTTSTLALQFVGTPTTALSYTITCSWIHN